MTLAQPVFTKGDGKRVPQITLDNSRPVIVASGLATDPEINDLMVKLDAFSDDPETLVGFPRV